MLLEDSQPIGIIPTRDYEKSRKFYESALGLKFIEQDSFALVFKSGGSKIRISKVETHVPSQHPILGWEVANIESFAKALEKNKIAFERYDFLAQDSMGVWTSPEGGKVGFVKDPDGNLLSITDTYKTKSK